MRKLRFADGFEIEMPQKGSWIMFLWHNYPLRLPEYIEYLDKYNENMKDLDNRFKMQKRK